MPKKSIRFIARDMGRSIDYIKRLSFSTPTGTWTCTECGYENDVTENNIRI